MTRIIKIGMDVHSTNYTLCALEPLIGEDDRVFANIKVTPDYKNILMFIDNLKQKLGPSDDYLIECGYEAVLAFLYAIRLRLKESNAQFLLLRLCLLLKESA